MNSGILIRIYIFLAQNQSWFLLWDRNSNIYMKKQEVRKCLKGDTNDEELEAQSRTLQQNLFCLKAIYYIEWTF